MNNKGCIKGDAIFSNKIDNYIGLIDKDYISDNRAFKIYNDIKDMMLSKGYKGNIEPLKSSNISKLYKDRNFFRDSDRVNYVLKILIKRENKFNYVSLDTQLSKIGALMQNILILEYGNLGFINFLRKKLNSSISKISSGYLKPYYDGFIIADILCNPIGIMDYLDDREKFDRFNRYIEILNNNTTFINENLESCKVVKIYRDIGNNIMNSDYNLYIGEIDKTKFSDLSDRYKEWYYGLDYDKPNDSKLKVLASDIRASIRLMLKSIEVDRDKIDIRIVDGGDKWYIGMFMLVSVSPYLLIKGLYSKVKLTDIYQDSKFLLVGTYKPLSKLYKGSNSTYKGFNDSQVLLYKSKICRGCGNDLYYSSINKDIEPMCPRCRMMKMLGVYANKSRKV